jgi:hypothetical protein
MKCCLVVEFESLWLTLANVLKVDVKDLAESWPQNINRNLFKHVVQDIYAVNLLHLLFALLVDLNHDQD